MHWDYWADLLKAMAHPIRLKILERLLEDDACVKDLWGCLDLPQAVVSQHLAILRNKGIVKCQREGNTVRYYVRDPKVREIIIMLKEEKDASV
ncbi:MAG: ArsR family transcriptional regulator [Deltaproteobacteria bacterium]|nr:MAG: ArsR family transcriptional regulator [Deltaproteobacteria bacterium]